MLDFFLRPSGDKQTGRAPAPLPIFNDQADYERMWSAIYNFPIDDTNAEKPLSHRLAREQGWTTSFTERVIEEYRRFLFLMAVSEHSITPSITVDEAWHLHLIYSQNYWVELCLYTIGKPLHHNPSSGNVIEDSGFESAYCETIKLYRHFFGDPPADIWGPENGKNVQSKPERNKP